MEYGSILLMSDWWTSISLFCVLNNLTTPPPNRLIPLRLDLQTSKFVKWVFPEICEMGFSRVICLGNCWVDRSSLYCTCFCWRFGVFWRHFLAFVVGSFIQFVFVFQFLFVRFKASVVSLTGFGILANRLVPVAVVFWWELCIDLVDSQLNSPTLA